MKKLIEASEAYLKALSENTEASLQVYINPLIKDIDFLISKAKDLVPKRKYVQCGSFNLDRRIDLVPGTVVNIEIFGRQTPYNVNDDIKQYLLDTLFWLGIDLKYLIYVDGKTDITADRIQFDFVLETDQEYKETEIRVVLPSGALNVFGYVYFNKINLGYNTSNKIDPELFNRPLKGFRIPYNQDYNNLRTIVDLLIKNIIERGETADFRALTSFSENERTQILSLYKSEFWNRIIMPGAVYYLRAGKYIKA